MHDQIPENITNGIKISVIDFFKNGDEKDKCKNKVEKAPKKVKKPKQFSKDKLAIFFAEFVGTGILVFLGCMGCISGVNESVATHHMGSLSFGLVVMMVIQIFGHISGAHLNPAVTIATVYLGYVKLTVSIIYFLAEFSGALAGFALLKLLAPAEFMDNDIFDPTLNETIHKTGVCSTVPYSGTTAIQALVIEAILTSVLILVCCAVWDRRNADKPDSTPLRFGFIIAAIGMVAGPFTGASMNTARTLGPAVLNGDWNAHWVYWVGPTLGAFIGAGLYKALFWPPKDPINETKDPASEQDAI